MKIITQNEEHFRVLLHALELYKRTMQEALTGSAFQREIARYEAKLANELMTQVLLSQVKPLLRIALPTIAPKKK